MKWSNAVLQLPCFWAAVPASLCLRSQVKQSICVPASQIHAGWCGPNAMLAASPVCLCIVVFAVGPPGCCSISCLLLSPDGIHCGGLISDALKQLLYQRIGVAAQAPGPPRKVARFILAPGFGQQACAMAVTVL